MLEYCNEYLTIIDDIYENIETFKHSRGHIVKFPTVLYKILLKTIEPDVECLETDMTIEIDEDELINMINDSYKLLHEPGHLI